MSKLKPVVPQPQQQSGRLFIPLAGLADVVNQTKPTISGLQANVTAATVSYGQTDILGTLKIAAFAISFSTNAVIAAGTQLFIVTFTVPFVNVPIVICGGGPQFTNAFEAVGVTATLFDVFNVNAVGNAANQGMQFIAIGH